MKTEIVRILSAIIAVVCLAGAVGCGSETLADEGEVIAAAKELLTAAVEVNRIFFWGGLEHDEPTGDPSIDMGDAVYAELSGDNKYIDQTTLMDKVRLVYTESYSNDIETVAFEGVKATGDTALLARYVSESGIMKINVSQAENALPERIPDVDSVRLSDEKGASGKDFATLIVDTLCDGEHEEISVTLRLEDNGWRLDTPTY